ncbi:unnamed protein product (mitochondrion) [Plasmodiophora brassicae]|uniref:Uncharacterized protein n=1 Tax=Plasmodiophora brassicae TaxID=37360 RepID=A0A0G4ISD6_PLABS|nr:hypothetical protein PBRA_006368 [Plasmodiophora brassicae]SPQ95173.1 unnamed protein product [Plasmodiophora brassicae]
MTLADLAGKLRDQRLLADGVSYGSAKADEFLQWVGGSPSTVHAVAGTIAPPINAVVGRVDSVLGESFNALEGSVKAVRQGETVVVVKDTINNVQSKVVACAANAVDRLLPNEGDQLTNEAKLSDVNQALFSRIQDRFTGYAHAVAKTSEKLPVDIVGLATSTILASVSLTKTAKGNGLEALKVTSSTAARAWKHVAKVGLLSGVPREILSLSKQVTGLSDRDELYSSTTSTLTDLGTVYKRLLLFQQIAPNDESSAK